ncbi:C39 family peptidase [Vibrio agarivorans]|uniref:C39 family peptidase n=1 Tax=Vibrio agarivorans TaxID=153622 RepID=UPI002230BFD3|nr:C39 family peptidase [Vibrio agarivorans]MDN3662433.1 C39 family peptidase [Vibrio agarivorans]
MKISLTLTGLVLMFSTSAWALEFLSHRAHYSVPIKSYKEMVFGDVFRQIYDFSCGSAALATMLTYHYDKPTSEEEAFNAMYQAGDKQIIKEKGFSLLDMKSYLHHQGLNADGFQIELTKLKSVGVPAITLVNFDGYMHFVVIKGINDHSVILGDPSRGTLVMPIEQFQPYYQGIVLLIKNQAQVGKQNFVSDNHFSIYTASPLKSGINRDSLGIFTLTLPSYGEN